METERCLQWWWYLIILPSLGIVGIVLIWGNPELPYWVKQMSGTVRADGWSRLIGIYLLSAVLTHVLIFFSLRIIDVVLELVGPITKPDLWAPTLVGLCESILYPTAMIMGNTEFVGLWLGIKVAGGWIRWGGVGTKTNDKNEFEIAKEGRRRFHKFLIGNALSILAAAITYGLLRGWVLNN